MAFLSSLDISGSALTAERLRMDIISENMANAETTRTEQGGPYRRKMTVFSLWNRPAATPRSNRLLTGRWLLPTVRREA